MLIGIEGGLGTGKTIMLLRYLLKDYNNKHDVYANFGIKHIKYNNLNLQELLKYEKEQLNLFNATIGIDEITVMVDCRTSMSRRNRIFSYFILQSRKRNVNVYYTSQDLSMLDKRLVAHTHIVVICEMSYNRLNEVIPNYRYYTIVDMRNRNKTSIHRFHLNISKYYSFYDTDEIIQPFMDS